MELKAYSLKGFPELAIDKVELPNIATLIAMPWFQYADINDVYKYGGEVYRKILSQTPLSGKKKNAIITSRVQYLHPSKMSIKFVGRWHTDSSGYPLRKESNDLVHLLLSKCTAITQFNTRPMEIEGLNPNIHQSEFNQILESNKDKFGLIPKSIETERFVTFDHHHAHRAVPATEQEFRFMFRVIETDDFEPESIEKSILNVSFNYDETPNGNQRVIDGIEKTAEYSSIVKQGGKVIIQL